MVIHPYSFTAFALVAPLWSLSLHKSGFGKGLLLVSLLAIFCLINTFFRLGIERLTVDFWGHIDYIKYIQTHIYPPDPTAGWQFYHPPLYYWIAAICAYIGKLMEMDYYLSIRLISMLCMFVFLYFALKLVREFIHNPYMRMVCSVMIMFWPINFGFVGRISNDVILYPAWAAFFLYLYRWHKDLRANDLAISFYLCGLMLLVKNTGILPLAECGVVVLYNLLAKRVTLRYFFGRTVLLAGLALVLMFSVNFGRTVYYKFASDSRLGLIVGNIYLDPMLKVVSAKNNYEEMFKVKISTFFGTPFWGIWAARGSVSGKEYLPSSYMKSLIFGEFYWPNKWLAMEMDISLMLMMLFLTLTCFSLKRWLRQDQFLAFNLFFILFAYTVNRLINMTYPTEDARFVFPSMLLIVALCASNIERLFLQRNLFVASYGLLLMSLFAISCLYFSFTFAMS